LVDLPVGVYFRKFLNEVTAGAASDENVEIDTKFIAEVMKDYSLQQIQLRVKKIWLHEFYDFCTTKLNGVSQEMMRDLLKFESDLMTIQVIENSRNYSQLVSARGREAERKKYISKVGYLYPDRSERLSNVQDFKSLVVALEATPYEAMLKQVSTSEEGRHEAESSGATIGKFSK
jgi:V-type H+-transporting ATPase subunit d